MSGTAYDLQTPRDRSVSSNLTRNFTRRDFLAGSSALLTGLTLDAGMIGRHDLEVVPRTINMARFPEAFHGFRIVQVSDIHLDEYTEPLFLRLVIDRVNRLAPDLVLLTGDFASQGPLPLPVSIRAVERCADLLRSLTCAERYACLGNHDNNISGPLVVNALTANGIPVLVDRYVPIERAGKRLWLAGINDPGTSHPNLDLALPPSPESPILLMCHAPDFVDSLVRHPRGRLVDLVLSGHTHGGQVRLPFLGPLVLPPLGMKYVEGLFRFGPTQLYVNRGVGTTGIPFRFNCRPEITLLTLQPA